MFKNLDEAMEEYLKLQDVLKEKETSLQDMNQLKINFEEDKKKLETQVSELQESNRRFFNRIMTQEANSQTQTKPTTEQKQSTDDGQEKAMSIEELLKKF